MWRVPWRLRFSDREVGDTGCENALVDLACGEGNNKSGSFRLVRAQYIVVQIEKYRGCQDARAFVAVDEGVDLDDACALIRSEVVNRRIVAV